MYATIILNCRGAVSYKTLPESKPTEAEAAQYGLDEYQKGVVLDNVSNDGTIHVQGVPNHQEWIEDFDPEEPVLQYEDVPIWCIDEEAILVCTPTIPTKDEAAKIAVGQ